MRVSITRGGGRAFRHLGASPPPGTWSCVGIPGRDSLRIAGAALAAVLCPVPTQTLVRSCTEQGWGTGPAGKFFARYFLLLFFFIFFLNNQTSSLIWLTRRVHKQLCRGRSGKREVTRTCGRW